MPDDNDNLTEEEQAERERLKRAALEAAGTIDPRQQPPAAATPTPPPRPQEQRPL